MSTYVTAETALLTQIRSYNSGLTFTEDNSSRGDFRVLNNTAVAQAAVLMQAGRSEFGDNLGQGRGSMGKRQQRHRIGIILFQARAQNNDGVTYQSLVSLTDGLITYLDKYPLLGGATSVKRAEVVEASEPRIRRDRPWIYQSILVEVLTETAIAAVELIR
jgi:hypothetical protein